ncbi:MAG TPA: hypothetical protein VGL10_04465 [Gammaproteobacteria bacterium]
MRKTVLMIVLTWAVSGCGSVPMTHTEYRDAVKQSDSSLLTRDSFEVGRSFADVSRSIQRKASECLNYQLAINIRENNVNRIAQERGKPTLIASKNKLEMYFQAKVTPSGNIMKEPPDGLYLLLAEAYPIGKGRTKVDIYRARVEVVAQAIKAWAWGKEQGCPDPARIFPR